MLVVDKPPLIATMGAAAGETSLAEVAREYLRSKYEKPGKVYLGVVSRLDSWVSGVIVFARTSKAADRLSHQFRERTCRKTYLAIVPDRADLTDSGRLENYLIKNEAQHCMAIVSSVDNNRGVSKVDAQFASLAYRTLGRSGPHRLLEIDLETGRKHQIRVQLSAAGCSILGDLKYGSDARFPKGIALHSYRLRIEHPTKKETLNFEVEPPEYWKLSRFGWKL